MDKEKIPGYLVYLGTREGDHLFYRINSLEENDGRSSNEFENTNKLHLYEVKVFLFQRIGAIYKAEFMGGILSYNKGTKPESLWANVEDIIRWKALQVGEDNRQKIVDKTKDNQLRQTLKPIREAYINSDYIGRRVILAEVIRLITGGRE